MDSEYLEERLEESGELMIVLDSGVEYDLHTHTSEIDHEEGMIRTEGMKDGEHMKLEIPVSAVEHTYIHLEA